MTPAEINFILDNAPSIGCELVKLSLQKDQGMWKDFLKFDFVKKIRKCASNRRDLLLSLGWLKNTDNAITVLSAILKDLTPKQRESMFVNTQGGGVIVDHWMAAIRFKDENELPCLQPPIFQHLRGLAGTMSKFGIDFNTNYSNSGYGKSVLSETVACLLHYSQNIFRHEHEEKLKFMMSLSPVIDDATKIRVLEHREPNSATALIDFFEANGCSKKEEWLSVASHPRVNKDTLAFFQARIARDAIEEAIQGSFLASPTRQS